METRLVPDAPGAWLVYDLGSLVFAVPPQLRAAADAIAASTSPSVPGVIAAVRSAGIAGGDFAILDAAAGLHVALRGPATVAAGSETLTGLDAEPWLERVIPHVPVVRLTVPGGEWTLTLAAPQPLAGPAPASGVSASTEVPEVSAPPPPPRLGFGDPEVIVAPAAAIPREAVPALEQPDGSRTPLDGAVFVGRAPTAPADAAPSRLVRLEGDGDISRTHARVDVEGGTVLVTDLESRNGTVVRIPGRAPQKLRAGEPTPVLVGTVIDFGGGLELTVREG